LAPLQLFSFTAGRGGIIYLQPGEKSCFSHRIDLMYAIKSLWFAPPDYLAKTQSLMIHDIKNPKSSQPPTTSVRSGALRALQELLFSAHFTGFT
jgi:hypothetical protein